MSRLGIVPIHASKHADGGLDEIIDALDIRALAKVLYYGVSWDESQATGGYIRTGNLAGIAVGSSPTAALIPIQAAMRRCVINDAGVVQYYLDPDDSTKKENGDPANLDGSDGQVVVEIPKFYHRYSYSNNIHTWDVILYPFGDFSVHPAFIKNGVEVDYRYIGAYEGILYDNSRSAYTNGLQLTAGSTDFIAATKTIHRDGESHAFSLLEVGDKLVIAGATDAGNNQTVTVNTIGDASIIVDEVIVERQNDASVTIETEKDFVNDKLCSVSGKAPINYGTRANFRALAAKRGTGWRQQDYDLASAVQLLYLIEYADWNSQSMIGNGLTDWVSETWDAWNDYNPIETAGNSNSNGNATANNSAGSGNTGSYMSYRGIENFFGHIWKWVDGININNNVPYVCNDDSDFADDISTNYVALGITLINSNGYVVTLEEIERGFLPASIGGSSSTYVCDYYYQAAGWRVARLGGYASSGLYAGVASWALFFASGTRSRRLGGRLAF